MIKKIFILLLVTYFFLNISCEKEIDYHFNDAPNKLVVFCFFSPDSIWKAQVYKLKKVSLNLDTINFYVPNADVRIYNKDSLIDILKYIGNGIYISQDSIKPEQNGNYRIEVSCPGFPDVKSDIETIPETPEVNLISYSNDIEFEKYNYEQSYIEYLKYANFSEYKASIRNGSNLRIRGKVKFLSLYPEFSSLIYDKYVSNDLTWSILNMSNQTDTIDFVLSSGNEIKGCYDYSELSNADSLTISFCNLSDEYYKFLLSLYKQEKEQDGDVNIFLSSTDIYSNLQDGIGVFASYSSIKYLKVKFTAPPEDFFYFDCNN